MLNKKMYFFMFVIFAFGCKNYKHNNNEINNIDTAISTKVFSKIDTTNAVSHLLEVNDDKFILYKKDGILLAGKIRIFDDAFNEKGSLNLKDIVPIQILWKSKLLYPIKSEKCSQAYFVKLNYNNVAYTVFGKDVYEIDEKEKHAFKNALSNMYKFCLATDFTVGASDSSGLTSCHDYSILLIKRLTDNKYSLIQTPKTENHETNDTNFFALIHDDQGLEEIGKVSVLKDTIVLGIKGTYQEGGGSYNLKFVYNDTLSKAIISDEKRWYDNNEK